MGTELDDVEADEESASSCILLFDSLKCHSLGKVR